MTAAIVVHVDPSGICVQVEPGETLMAAAERQGLRWPTLCHGQAICTACAIVVTGDPDAFQPPEPLENKGLELFAGRSFYLDKVVRLACQSRPVTDTTVTKRGVRPVEAPPP